MTNSLYIADDHPIVREGLASHFRSLDDFEIYGVGSSGEAALNAMRQPTPPDAAILDLIMPKKTGIEVVMTARDEMLPTKLILLTADHPDPEVVLKVVEAGACAFLIKSLGIREISEAIYAVCDGGVVVCPKIMAECIAALRGRVRRPPSAPTKLTSRECEILAFLSRGHSRPQVAKNLHIAESTVTTHTKRCIEKLGVSGQTAAVAKAIRTGLIE